MSFDTAGRVSAIATGGAGTVESAYRRCRPVHAPVAQWIEQPPPKGQVGRSIRLRGASTNLTQVHEKRFFGSHSARDIAELDAVPWLAYGRTVQCASTKRAAGRSLFCAPATMAGPDKTLFHSPRGGLAVTMLGFAAHANRFPQCGMRAGCGAEVSQSIWILASSITRFHLTISAAMNFSNCSEVLATTVLPSFSRLALTSG